MRVAILGEDNVHEALLRGLLLRWCPGAEPVTGEFRGATGKSRRREVRDELDRLIRCANGCECAAILVDADKHGWKVAMSRERDLIQSDLRDLAAVGAPDRNVECWLAADPRDLASETGLDAEALAEARQGDPKRIVTSAFQALAEGTDTDANELVVRFVAGAPLAQWLAAPSFKAFYEQCQSLATTLGCSLPNEMDSKERTH